MLTRCPHCKHHLTDEELKSLWAQRNGRLRAAVAGPGRPRTAERCQCGMMTLKRAATRNHKCAPNAINA